LIAITARNGPRWFVGVSGPGIDIPGDSKTAINKAIFALIGLLGGAVVKDNLAGRAHPLSSASGADHPGVEARQMQTPVESGVLDLQAAVHYDGQAGGLTVPGHVVVPRAELEPQGLRTDREGLGEQKPAGWTGSSWSSPTPTKG